MLDALARGIAVVTKAGANAGVLLAATEAPTPLPQMSTIRLAVENDFGQCFGIIWIIDRRVTGCADVDDGVPCQSQVLADKLL